jgi:gamma-glutamyl hercynylcysteine S-oxide synthase
MASSQAAVAMNQTLLSRLEEGRARTDALFDLLKPDALYERPIPERHRLIFYLGHLEAFDWNLLAATLGLKSHEAEFDKLFAFGIDPVGGGLPTDVPGDWPSADRVREYVRQGRRRIDDALHSPHLEGEYAQLLMNGTFLDVAIEHRLMHAETLAYLWHNLPFNKKTGRPLSADATPAPAPRQAEIPAGAATLGQCRSGGKFGWDNEFDEQQLQVPSFSIDVFPVTNSQFLKFVQAGGYQQPRYWRSEDWDWRRAHGIEHPGFWIKPQDSVATDPHTEWQYRGMLSAIPLPAAWPVYVSYAEAYAFANWAGKKLPTEPQWQRAAYGTPEGGERSYPWGETAPDSERGNFHFARWDAAPVDAHPAGASAFGAQDLLGNGWEWTSTPFGPLPGFEPFPFYRGYSADFFDGKHFVMKGGSPQTDACMLRRSFRNWFQPHYPYVYATFRCVED